MILIGGSTWGVTTNLSDSWSEFSLLHDEHRDEDRADLVYRGAGEGPEEEDDYEPSEADMAPTHRRLFASSMMLDWST